MFFCLLLIVNVVFYYLRLFNYYVAKFQVSCIISFHDILQLYKTGGIGVNKIRQ